MPAQKYCAFCGKRTKNTGGWYYAPIFCSTVCERAYRQKHELLMKTDKKYAAESKRYSALAIIYIFIFGILPFLVLMYAIFFN